MKIRTRFFEGLVVLILGFHGSHAAGSEKEIFKEDFENMGDSNLRANIVDQNLQFSSDAEVTATLATDQKHSGRQSLQVSFRSDENKGYLDVHFKKRVRVDSEGKQVVFKMWVYGSKDASLDLARVQFVDSKEGVFEHDLPEALPELNREGWHEVRVPIDFEKLQGSWKGGEGQPNEPVYPIYFLGFVFHFHGDVTRSSIFYIDDITLMEKAE